MNKSIQKVTTGSIALAVLMVAGLACNSASEIANLANSSTSNASTPAQEAAVPSNQVVEGLVKETIDKFGAAVQTGDYSELHAYSSTNFQTTYSVDQVAEGFQEYTKNKKTVTPLLTKAAGLDAEFDRPPTVRKERGSNILVASGKFQTKPYNVRFDFEYVMLGGEWKLLKLVINIP